MGALQQNEVGLKKSLIKRKLKELQKANQKEFRIEKVIKRKVDELYGNPRT